MIKPDYLQRMVAVDCKSSLNQYLENGLYYHPTSWAFQSAAYLGLYDNQTIKAIGHIRRIIDVSHTVNFLSSDAEVYLDDIVLTTLNIEDEEVVLTELEKQRVITGLTNLSTSHPHRFYFVDQFYLTSFKAPFPLSMASRRYFDLYDYLYPPLSDSTADMAKQLNGRYWL